MAMENRKTTSRPFTPGKPIYMPDLYDTTRSHLLKGRETMLQLLAAHLKAQPVVRLPVNAPTKPKIWVDLGGGTGWNIEKM